MACARRGERGLSLVEVLVALSVGALIATAGLALAQVLARVNRDQAMIQSLTDNLRGALMQIGTDARMAGAGMGGTDAYNAVTSSPARVEAVRVVNSSTAPDQIDLLTAPGSGLATSFASTITSSTSLTVDSSGGANFAVGDYALLTNFTDSILYRVSSTGNTVVSGVSARALGVSPPASFPATTFPAGSLLMKASVLRYSVGLGTAVGMPTRSVLLVEDGAPLGATTATSMAAEDVIDMQIAMGIDGINGQAADGQLVEVGAAANDDEWVYNIAGDTLPASPYTLRALRITLVGRSSSEGQQLGNGRPRAEDRAAGSADRFRWRLQREVVMIRNLVNQ